MDDAAKRKRISGPEGEPDAKRAAAQLHENNIFASKDPRAALAEVYAAYDALHCNRYTSDDDIKAGEAHFAILLSAVQGIYYRLLNFLYCSHKLQYISLTKRLIYLPFLLQAMKLYSVSLFVFYPNLLLAFHPSSPKQQGHCKACLPST